MASLEPKKTCCLLKVSTCATPPPKKKVSNSPQLQVLKYPSGVIERYWECSELELWWSIAEVNPHRIHWKAFSETVGSLCVGSIVAEVSRVRYGSRCTKG